MTDQGTDHAPPAHHDLPRLLPFRDLPRQPLRDGRGTVREIRAETAPGLDLRWQLQLVELKGPRGTLATPAGTHQRIVGLAGPQVAVGDSMERCAPLGRDRALLLRSPTVVFQRPRLRVAGASTVLVLTFAAGLVPPRFAFRTLDTFGDDRAGDPAEGADSGGLSGTHLLLLLQGDLRIDGVEASRQSVVLLDARATHRVSASAARVLTLGDEPDTGV